MTSVYRKYVFTANNKSGSVTYPTKGRLVTYGEAGTDIDYLSSSSKKKPIKKSLITGLLF